MVRADYWHNNTSNRCFTCNVIMLEVVVRHFLLETFEYIARCHQGLSQVKFAKKHGLNG